MAVEAQGKGGADNEDKEARMIMKSQCVMGNRLCLQHGLCGGDFERMSIFTDGGCQLGDDRGE